MRERLIAKLIFSFLILILLLSIMNGSIYLTQQGVFSVIPDHILVTGVSITIIIGLAINGYLVRSLLQLVEKEAEYNSQVAYFLSTEELFRSIKSQRHDFNNHVQTIYGMLKENMIELAKEYITDVFKETRELNDIIIIDRPEIAALVKAKHSKAIAHNINFVVAVNSKLSHLKVKPHELVRMIGNIIDNAFDATLLFKGQKNVRLDIYEQGNGVNIEVTNHGTLPEDIVSVFRPGVSTKEGHTGLGLYIVNQLAEQYNGKVMLENLDGKVICRLFLPAN